MSDPVVLVAEGPVATLLLNRPERRNAVSLEMRGMLKRALDQIAGDPAIRALVLTGAGGSFCAGGDIRDMEGAGHDPEEARRRMGETGKLAVALSKLGIPVVAAVDGPAYGAGFGMAMAADIVLAGPGARFCASFGRLGLVPDFALHWSLPRRVGPARAKELFFSAREVGAEEAVTLGIADRLVRGTETATAARELAESFVSASPTALALSKRIVDREEMTIEQVVEAEGSAQALCFSTGYHKEARRRFLSR
ncbi:enoyl-CoA hydratase/isomerase family protein [Cribrihabitans sp. XS_ASV171]